jgi:tryptophan-rich sensory protein
MPAFLLAGGATSTRRLALAKTSAAVLVTAIAGGLASRPARSGWYERLQKPGFQPPRQVFSIVWPLLYTDIAVVSAAAIDELHNAGYPERAEAYEKALAVNLAMNGSWAWLFFSRHRLGASAVVAAALTVSSADLTRRAIEANHGAATPLALYPLWCAFGTVLSTRIWMLNQAQSKGSCGRRRSR